MDIILLSEGYHHREKQDLKQSKSLLKCSDISSVVIVGIPDLSDLSKCFKQDLEYLVEGDDVLFDDEWLQDHGHGTLGVCLELVNVGQEHWYSEHHESVDDFVGIAVSVVDDGASSLSKTNSKGVGKNHDMDKGHGRRNQHRHGHLVDHVPCGVLNVLASYLHVPNSKQIGHIKHENLQ